MVLVAEYQIKILANLKARNLDSATKKLEAIKQRVGRVADWTEVHLKAQEPKRERDE